MNTHTLEIGTRTGFRASSGKGFHFPKASEFEAMNRGDQFDRVCDTLRSVQREDHLLRQQDMRIVFDKNGARLHLGRDGKPLLDGNGVAMSFDVDLDAPFMTQTCADLGLDAGFVNRMIDSDTPEWRKLANAVVNQALTLPLKEDQDGDRKRMIRLFQNAATMRMEAVSNLSNGFLRIDNAPLADWVWNLKHTTPLIPLHWDFNKGDFVMNALLPLARNVAHPSTGKHDDVFFGLTVRNSMTGGSSLMVQSFMFRRVCDNGMMRTVNSIAMRRAHRGRRQNQIGQLHDSAYELNAVQEILHSASINAQRLLRDDVIDAEVLTMRNAQDPNHTYDKTLSLSMVEASPVKKALSKALEISQEDAQVVLTNLWTNPGGGVDDEALTQWGMVNAITAAAHDQTFNKAQDFMRLGGKVLDWAPGQFTHTLDGLWEAFARV